MSRVMCLVMAALLAATACTRGEPTDLGGASEEAGSPTPTATAPTASAPATAEEVADPTPGASATPVGDADVQTVATDDYPHGPGDVAHLVDVRAAGHPGFDRVVLEFEGANDLSYEVGYVQPPIHEDPSGHEVDVAGEAFLAINLAHASGVDMEHDYESTYTGPTAFHPTSTHAVVEVIRTSDFEAHLTWVVGLRTRTPFAVEVLHDPLRLVVDVVG